MTGNVPSSTNNLHPKCSNCSEKGVRLWLSLSCGHCTCTECLSNNEPVQQCCSLQQGCPVRCIHTTDGCPFVGGRHDVHGLQVHAEQCSYNRMPCPNGCPVVVHKADLSDHLPKDCPKRLVLCEFCQGGFYPSMMDEHVEACGHRPTECSFCGLTGVPKQGMNRHLVSCELAIKQCVFRDLGCTFEGTASEMRVHLTLYNHARSLSDFLQESRNEVRSMMAEVKAMKRDTAMVQARINNQANSFMDKLNGLEKRVEELEKDRPSKVWNKLNLK